MLTSRNECCVLPILFAPRPIHLWGDKPGRHTQPRGGGILPRVPGVSPLKAPPDEPYVLARSSSPSLEKVGLVSGRVRQQSIMEAYMVSGQDSGEGSRQPSRTKLNNRP